MSKIILPSRRKLLLGAASLIAAPAIVRAQIISDEGVFGASGGGGSSLLTNIVGYWKFSEGSGTSVADATGLNSAATLSGSPTWTTGIIDDAVSYTAGSSQYCDLGAGSGLVCGAGSFSVNFWANNLSTVVSGFPVSSRSASGAASSGFDFLAALGNTPGIGYPRVSDGTTIVNAASGITYPTTGWVMISFVIDRGTNLLITYINGTHSGVDPSISGLGSITNSQNPSVAKRGTTFVTAVVDELGMWSRALTSTEITTLYNSGAAKQYPF